MENIGELLRTARIEKNIKFEDVEKDTKIRRRYLEALENEEWDVIPGNVYLKGFMKTYARYLGLNEELLLDELEKVIKPDHEAKPIPEKIELPGRPKKKIAIFLGCVAILILVASQYVYQHYFNLPDANTKEQTEQQNTNNQAPPDQNTNNQADNQQTGPDLETSAPEITDFDLLIKTVRNRCWIQVKSGGKVIYEGTLSAGQSQLFENLTEVAFVLGNAPDVEVYINDKYYGPYGLNGEVVNKKFIIENNQVQEIVP